MEAIQHHFHMVLVIFLDFAFQEIYYKFVPCFSL